MHQFISGPPSAIAVTLSGTITNDDLDMIIDRLERVMKASPVTDVFVETRGISGIQLSALASYAPRAMPLLGKLKSFGRVAVAADQAWIRAGSRLESALLPFISYKVFGPERRNEAIDWVFHRETSSVRPTVADPI